VGLRRPGRGIHIEDGHSVRLAVRAKALAKACRKSPKGNGKGESTDVERDDDERLHRDTGSVGISQMSSSATVPIGVPPSSRHISIARSSVARWSAPFIVFAMH